MGDQTPESALCDYLMPFFPLFTWPSPSPLPHHSPMQVTCQFGSVCFLGQVLIYADCVGERERVCGCVCEGMCGLPVKDSAPVTEDVSKSISQPLVKKNK